MASSKSYREQATRQYRSIGTSTDTHREGPAASERRSG
jgi:hypothetical protein